MILRLQYAIFSQSLAKDRKGGRLEVRERKLEIEMEGQKQRWSKKIICRVRGRKKERERETSRKRIYKTETI